MKDIDYAGKSDRELLVEVVTTVNAMKEDMEDVRGVLENHEGQIDELQTSQNKAKGGILAACLIASLAGLKAFFGL